MAASKELEPTQNQLHVLMVTLSAQGHINPLLRLANSLISKNLHVTFATTQALYHRMFNSSSTAAAAAAPTSITINGFQVLFFSDGFNSHEERSKNTDIDHYMESIESSGPTSVSDLVRTHFSERRRQLACIVNTPFVPWVADVAAELGIPCACLWIQPCALYAIYYHRFVANLAEEFSRDAVELPGFPLLQPRDLPSFLLPSNPFGSFSKMLEEMFQKKIKDGKFRWVLANSFYDLEKDVIDSMALLSPILPVGPLVPSSLLTHDDQGVDEKQDVGIEMWKAQESCMEWLSNKAPCSVIYISFGSLIVLSSKDIESIANALKKSKRHFLWVMKVPEREASSGAGQLPLGFLEETKEQGLVVSWCPQTKVLSHPSIACFLTHCGWNSMLEAISAGIPMVAYPKWTDQPTNAKLLTDVFQTGTRLWPDRDGVVGSEEVERAIEEVVGGPRSEEIKKNAERLKRAAREAVADGGSSDRAIQSFVDEIIGSYRG
ncbi:UDP-glycosyltransferase 84B2-like [Senna tora]|uniref:Glycosyltransferase n=1 Tax=Senna tora TaxID=362788 RepID=A0A834SVX5_9FABA|nr:UDP-glycosyltransferase 84B2-like [Senna tora]